MNDTHNELLDILMMVTDDINEHLTSLQKEISGVRWLLGSLAKVRSRAEVKPTDKGVTAPSDTTKEEVKEHQDTQPATPTTTDYKTEEVYSSRDEGSIGEPHSAVPSAEERIDEELHKDEDTTTEENLEEKPTEGKVSNRIEEPAVRARKTNASECVEGEEKESSEKAEETEFKTCYVCGKVFVPNPINAQFARYCCKECAAAARNWKGVIHSHRDAKWTEARYFKYYFESHDYKVPELVLERVRKEAERGDVKEPVAPQPIKYETKTCIVCGKQFTPSSFNQCACSDNCKTARHHYKTDLRRHADKTEKEFYREWFSRRNLEVPSAYLDTPNPNPPQQQQQDSAGEEVSKSDSKSDTSKSSCKSESENASATATNTGTKPSKEVEVNSQEFKSRLAKIKPVSTVTPTPNPTPNSIASFVTRICANCGKMEKVTVANYLSQPDFCDSCFRELRFADRKRVIDELMVKSPDEYAKRRELFLAICDRDVNYQPVIPRENVNFEGKAREAKEARSNSNNKKECEESDSESEGDRGLVKQETVNGKPKRKYVKKEVVVRNPKSPFRNSELDALLPDCSIYCFKCHNTVPCHKAWFAHSEVLCPSCYNSMSKKEISDYHKCYHKPKEIKPKEVKVEDNNKVTDTPLPEDRLPNKGCDWDHYFCLSPERIRRMNEVELQDAVKSGRLSRQRYRIEMRRRQNAEYYNDLPDYDPVEVKAVTLR